MTTQQADDVIAKLVRWTLEYDGPPGDRYARHVEDPNGGWVAWPHVEQALAALVERVSRQPQEVDGELLDRLEELAVWLDENAPVEHSTPWLVRRDVVREAGRQLAASVSHQQEPPKEPLPVEISDLNNRWNERALKLARQREEE